MADPHDDGPRSHVLITLTNDRLTEVLVTAPARIIEDLTVRAVEVARRLDRPQKSRPAKEDDHDRPA